MRRHADDRGSSDSRRRGSTCPRDRRYGKSFSATSEPDDRDIGDVEQIGVGEEPPFASLLAGQLQEVGVDADDPALDLAIEVADLLGGTRAAGWRR